MDKSMNPSSRRSRRYITEALLGIMLEKPFGKISITEITEKADVVRRTFYRNFESKEDVIETYIYSMFLNLNEQLMKLPDLNAYDTAKLYFEYMEKHKVFLKLLEENDLFIIVLKVLEDHIDEFNRKFKGDRIEDYDPKFLEYISLFKVAGMWRILKKWLNDGMQETPEQLASYFDQIVNNKVHTNQKDYQKH